MVDFNNSYVGDEIKVFQKVDCIKKEEEKKDVKAEKVIATYRGPMTAYGPDCYGCMGITASGYNVLNGNIYYKDKEYGKIRIVAADKSIPFGTIIRISDLNVFEDDILAIVLDRGSAIGFNRKSYFDLLYKSEKDTSFFGRRYAKFEILRKGY